MGGDGSVAELAVVVLAPAEDVAVGAAQARMPRADGELGDGAESLRRLGADGDWRAAADVSRRADEAGAIVAGRQACRARPIGQRAGRGLQLRRVPGLPQLVAAPAEHGAGARARAGRAASHGDLRDVPQTGDGDRRRLLGQLAVAERAAAPADDAACGRARAGHLGRPHRDLDRAGHARNRRRGVDLDAARDAERAVAPADDRALGARDAGELAARRQADRVVDAGHLARVQRIGLGIAQPEAPPPADDRAAAQARAARAIADGHLDGVRDARHLNGFLVVHEIAGAELARAVAPPTDDAALTADGAGVRAVRRERPAERQLRDPVQLERAVRSAPAAGPEGSDTADAAFRVDGAETVVAEGDLFHPLEPGDAERARGADLVLGGMGEDVEAPADHRSRRLRGAADLESGGDVDRGSGGLAGGRHAHARRCEGDRAREQCAPEAAGGHRAVTSIR